MGRQQRALENLMIILGALGGRGRCNLMSEFFFFVVCHIFKSLGESLFREWPPMTGDADRPYPSRPSIQILIPSFV